VHTWSIPDPVPLFVAIVDERIEAQGAEPRVIAGAQNIGVLPVGRVAVVVVAYDVDGNALAASRTLIDRLAAGESREVTFTWPTAWSAQAVSLDVIPVYDAPRVR
jgi:hypothetical protein